ncbi:MAG: DUF2080 family transposase-associated protein [Nanoarchaeota archaeon]
MMKEKESDCEFRMRGKEMIVKTVSKISTSGHVYVPRKWIGKKVAIVLEPESPK